MARDRVSRLSQGESMHADNKKSSAQSRALDDTQHDKPSPTITSHKDHQEPVTTLAAELVEPGPVSGYYWSYLKRQNSDDEVEFPLTITDPRWEYGNPTAVVTSIGRDKTVTLLYFTSTTLEWHKPDRDGGPETSTVTTTVVDGIVTHSPMTSRSDDHTRSSTTATTSKEHKVSTLVETVVKTATAIASVAGSASTTAAASHTDGEAQLSPGIIIAIAVGIGVLIVGVVIGLVPRIRQCFKDKRAKAQAIEQCRSYINNQQGWAEDNRTKDTGLPFQGTPVPDMDHLARHGPYQYPLQYLASPAAGQAAELHQYGSQHGSGATQQPRAYRETPISAMGHGPQNIQANDHQGLPVELPSNSSDVFGRP